MFGKRSKRGMRAVVPKEHDTSGHEIDKEIMRQLKILKLVTEEFSDGIIILKPDGKIHYINKRASELIYIGSSEESQTLAYFDEGGNKIPSESTPEAKLIRGEILENYVLQVERNGKPVYLSFSGKPVFNDNKLVCAILSIRDITEQTNMKVKEILEGFQDDFYILDANWNFVYASKSIPSKIGIELKELLGKNIWEIFPKLIGTELEENLRAAMKNREVRCLEVDGTYSEATYKKVIYPSTEGIAVLGKEITELKKYEEALFINENRIRAALNGSPIVIFSQDKDLRINWVCNTTPGFNAANILGKTDEEIFSSEDAEYLTSIKKEVLNTGVGRREEVVTHRHASSGGDMIHDLIIEPFTDKNGEITGVICTAIDITYPKKTEFELMKSQNEALSLVEELKAADQNKNAFLSALSHELRNPIAAISAGLQLMDITNDDNLTVHTKGIIKRQMKQLCSLVDDLTELSRMNMNKIELKRELLELSSSVLLVTEDFKSQFDEKGVILKTDISKEQVYINADPVRINQIIGNLLHNALKFTDTEDGCVLIKLYIQNENAVISVEDNGIGIAPEFLPFLFEPFKQADTSIDRKSGGLGLGLSIVKGMAELHGGSVSAASEGLGKGSSFYIHLPIAEGHIHHNKIEPATPENMSLRVLIIDDNKDFAHILTQALALSGHRADQAYDGFEGIQKAKDLLPDVILCDIGLPNMDGFNVAGSIRNDSTLEDTIIIALTGYASPNDLSRALNAGFNYHITKPVDLAALSEILRSIAQTNQKQLTE